MMSYPIAEIPSQIDGFCPVYLARSMLLVQKLSHEVVAYQRSKICITGSRVLRLWDVYILFFFLFLSHFNILFASSTFFPLLDFFSILSLGFIFGLLFFRRSFLCFDSIQLLFFTLLITLQLVNDFVLMQAASLLVMVSPLEPPILIQALSVEQDEAQASLVEGFIDSLADFSQVHGEDLIASHGIFLALVHEDEVAETLVSAHFLFEFTLLFFLLEFELELDLFLFVHIVVIEVFIGKVSSLVFRFFL